jgi:hypothetical protein
MTASFYLMQILLEEVRDAAKLVSQVSNTLEITQECTLDGCYINRIIFRDSKTVCIVPTNLIVYKDGRAHCSEYQGMLGVKMNDTIVRYFTSGQVQEAIDYAIELSRD